MRDAREFEIERGAVAQRRLQIVDGFGCRRIGKKLFQRITELAGEFCARRLAGFGRERDAPRACRRLRRGGEQIARGRRGRSVFGIVVFISRNRLRLRRVECHGQRAFRALQEFLEIGDGLELRVLRRL